MTAQGASAPFFLPRSPELPPKQLRKPKTVIADRSTDSVDPQKLELSTGMAFRGVFREF